MTTWLAVADTTFPHSFGSDAVALAYCLQARALMGRHEIHEYN
ncbi:hypothetical protein CAter282_1002 [Collimonas arenae]|uniref:Uncharacterized protein n=1 Tax=Collimonas arenae TaxID=279058 RepID=A0A127QFG1_9BURK|nr:hypothetical protein CAter10_1081 [Collimonas arenae]AMP08797.1 hypothetical protein CAter282_1002 [Collimonas arenae]